MIRTPSNLIEVGHTNAMVAKLKLSENDWLFNQLIEWSIECIHTYMGL